MLHTPLPRLVSRRSGETTSSPPEPSLSLQSVELESLSSDSTEGLLQYDKQETVKLRFRWVRVVCGRIALYAAAISMSCILISGPLALRTWFVLDTAKVDVRSRLSSLSTQCQTVKLREAGWTFDVGYHQGGVSRTHQDCIGQHNDSQEIRVKHEKGQKTSNLRMLESQKQMTRACADEWIAESRVCQHIQQGRRKLREAKVDIVWTFVEPTKHWEAWLIHLAGNKTEGTRGKNFR